MLPKRVREASPGPSSEVKTVVNEAGGKKQRRRDFLDDDKELVDNGDGTKTVRISLSPASFESGGSRRNADSSLDLKGGRYESKSTAEPVSIAARSGDDVLVSVGKPNRRLSIGRPNVSGLDDGKKQRTKTKRGVRAGEGEASVADDVVADRKGKRNSLAFGDTFGAGSELSYEVLPDAVKELIVLKSAPKSQPVFRFPINGVGLTNRKGKDGSFEFVDQVGTVVFSIPPSFAFDSRGGANTPGNAYVNVPAELRSDNDGLTLVVTPPLEWLRSKDRVYPISIDPTIQTQPWNPMNLGYMPWGDNSGGNSFSAWTNEMVFGNWWGSSWKSFIKFDPSLFAGRTINSTTLNLRVQNCDNQSNPATPYANPVYVSRLTSDYWFGQSWPGPAAGESVTGQPGGYGTLLPVDVTSFARQWATNSATNFGVALSMGGAQGYCRAQRVTAAGQQTFLEVTYNEAPNGAAEYGALKNFSFETGTSAWSPCFRAEFGTFSVQTGAGSNGTKFARVRSENSAGPVSICQTVPFNTGPGQTYNFSVDVRSATGAPVQGRALLWESGANPANTFQDFTANGTWTRINLSLPGQYASNIALRPEIMVGAPFTSDLDIDNATLTVTQNPPPPPPNPQPQIASALQPGQWLGIGQSLRSPNGAYSLVQQGDGNLVVYGPNGYTWANWQNGKPGTTTVMQYDGNLVSYLNGVAVWSSNTAGRDGQGVWLNMQNDGNLVLYTGADVAIWSSWHGLITQPPPTPTTTTPPTTAPPPPPAGALVQLDDSNPWFDGTTKFFANFGTGHCVFPKDYVVQAGSSIVAGDCNGGSSESWQVEYDNGFARLHPLTNASLCLDIDSYNGSANTLTPPNGARAQLFPCIAGAGNQLFYVVKQLTGFWQIQPQVAGGVGTQPKCLDEDANQQVANGPVFVVQHWDCGNQTNQQWAPMSTADDVDPDAVDLDDTLTDVVVIDAPVPNLLLPPKKSGGVPPAWVQSAPGVGVGFVFAYNWVRNKTTKKPAVFFSGCTATVLSGTGGRTILTALHCFEANGKTRAGKRWGYLPAKNDESREVNSGNAIAISKYRRAGSDFTVAQIATQANIGSAELTPVPNGIGETYSLFGYPRGGTTGLAYQCVGSATSTVGRYAVLPACNGPTTLKRVSGGPWFNSAGRVAGVSTNLGLRGILFTQQDLGWLESAKNNWS